MVGEMVAGRHDDRRYDIRRSVRPWTGGLSAALIIGAAGTALGGAAIGVGIAATVNEDPGLMAKAQWMAFGGGILQAVSGIGAAVMANSAAKAATVAGANAAGNSGNIYNFNSHNYYGADAAGRRMSAPALRGLPWIFRQPAWLALRRA